MSYNKLNLSNGDTLTAAHLQHIEDGIISAHNSGGGGSNEWKLIRTVTIPEDITTDTSGVNFAYATPNTPEKGVWFAFGTDENGNAFDVKEVFIAYYAAIAADNFHIRMDNRATPIFATQGFEVAYHANAKANVFNYGYSYFNIFDKKIALRLYAQGGANINTLTQGNALNLYQNNFTSLTAMDFCSWSGSRDVGLLPNSKFVIYGR